MEISRAGERGLDLECSAVADFVRAGSDDGPCGGDIRGRERFRRGIRLGRMMLAFVAGGGRIGGRCC